MIFVVESKNPYTDRWEVLPGAGACPTRADAEEEMQQDKADNPGTEFRIAAYVRHGERTQ